MAVENRKNRPKKRKKIDTIFSHWLRFICQSPANPADLSSESRVHSPPLQRGNLSEQCYPAFRVEEECQSTFPPAIPVAVGKRAWYFSLGCCPSLIHHHPPSSSPSPPFPPMRKFNPLAHTHLVNFLVPVCHCHHGNSPQR